MVKIALCQLTPAYEIEARKAQIYDVLLKCEADENRCWLATADWIWPEDGSWICPGHSVIYDPDGQEVARSHEGVEQLLTFDIPLESLIQDKGRRVYGSKLLAQTITNHYS